MFSKRHLKLILFLICIDVVSTLLWYTCFGVPEWNPLMDNLLGKSLVLFVIIKLSISFLPIIILSNHIKNSVSQVGVGIILATYSTIALMHYFVFFFLLLES